MLGTASEKEKKWQGIGHARVWVDRQRGGLKDNDNVRYGVLVLYILVHAVSRQGGLMESGGGCGHAGDYVCVSVWTYTCGCGCDLY